MSGFNYTTMRFSADDIYSVVTLHRKGEAVELGCIAMEAYIFDTASLYEHLAIFLNRCFTHCYLPES